MSLANELRDRVRDELSRRSQREIAKDAKMSQSSLSDFLRNVRTIRIDVARDLARAVGWELAFIMPEGQLVPFDREDENENRG